MRSAPFTHCVSSEEELRSLLGQPSQLVSQKVIHQLDGHCRAFIARSPLVLVATADASGRCDVSPRGDAPGFVQVLDDGRLAIPERPGNKRADTFRNLLANPQIGLLFLIPGLGETLRINGQACITQDPDLLATMAVQDKRPLLALGVAVEECYVHCAKAFIRSQLWAPDTWPAAGERPSPAEMLADHARVDGMDAATLRAYLQESYAKRLYY